MFQFKNAGLGMKELDKSNALPNTFGKVRTFKEDLENFEKGVSGKDVSEETAPLPLATQQRPVAETHPQKQELPRSTPTAPAAEYPPGSPFQSVPTPPPISSLDPGANANSETQPSPFESSSSQSFFTKKPVSKESFSFEQPKNKTLPQKESKSKNSLVLAFVIVFIVAAAGSGFYYYWFNIRNSSDATSSIPATLTPPVATPDTSSSTTDIQNKNLNNIIVDTSLGQTDIKNAIQKFATEFAASALESDIVEVKIIEKDGQSVGKRDFFSGNGMTIPDPVLIKLSEDYSLFVRKESDLVKLGFVFKTVTSSGLSDEMKNWESNLATDLASFHAGQTPTGTGIFNSSRYKNADIRYFNFSSPANTSIDYSIISNFLIIGTSKDTTRAILDYMSEK